MPLVDPELIKQARAALQKEAAIPIPIPLGGLIGAGIGGARAPAGHRMHGAARGGMHGLAIDAGMGLGGGLGALAGGLLAPNQNAGMALGGLAGLGLGGYGGHLAAQSALGKAPWDRELPHGVSGADLDEDEEGGRRKAASFAVRMGELAANKTRK